MWLKSQSQAYIVVGNKGSERLQRQRLESRAQSSIRSVGSSGLSRFRMISQFLSNHDGWTGPGLAGVDIRARKSFSGSKGRFQSYLGSKNQ